uniref:SUI1 domain-containing protein n=1 Tax=Chromera velia CCMP2878 TaxID=1169474 RepID=A0A0K6S7S8_9ALVE|eukprot:Cvel_21343.t1-p1 / transcript=Cvel_21343.t1 / gene=Cvel_21343 / organism=Chromera_velia_CCMP2878 / gene_product=Eukaryotic translation initiation factor 2D, putative / transcript_product=Eukaryotic translation initiation factor 2D, putative / location=Cvel_scaffold1992:1942-16634(+) / protein_length=832 / sequence_SO=supercontig / SO=protein_coding / is_pseudo=false
MFKKPLSLQAQNKLGKKDVKGLKTRLLSAFPHARPESLESVLSTSNMTMAKLSGSRHTLYFNGDDPVLLDLDGEIVPTVYGLWRAPDLLPSFVVHPPVSKFVLNGADLMLPGCVRPFGFSGLKRGQLRAVRVQGNPMPFAVGRSQISEGDAAVTGRGRALESLHWFGDCLWKEGPLSVPNSGFAAGCVSPIEEGGEGEETEEGDDDAETKTRNGKGEEGEKENRSSSPGPSLSPSPPPAPGWGPVPGAESGSEERDAGEGRESLAGGKGRSAEEDEEFPSLGAAVGVGMQGDHKKGGSSSSSSSSAGGAGGSGGPVGGGGVEEAEVEGEVGEDDEEEDVVFLSLHNNGMGIGIGGGGVDENVEQDGGGDGERLAEGEQEREGEDAALYDLSLDNDISSCIQTTASSAGHEAAAREKESSKSKKQRQREEREEAEAEAGSVPEVTLSLEQTDEFMLFCLLEIISEKEAERQKAGQKFLSWSFPLDVSVVFGEMKKVAPRVSFHPQLLMAWKDMGAEMNKIVGRQDAAPEGRLMASCLDPKRSSGKKTGKWFELAAKKWGFLQVKSLKNTVVITSVDTNHAEVRGYRPAPPIPAGSRGLPGSSQQSTRAPAAGGPLSLLRILQLYKPPKGLEPVFAACAKDYRKGTLFDAAQSREILQKYLKEKVKKQESGLSPSAVSVDELVASEVLGKAQAHVRVVEKRDLFVKFIQKLCPSYIILKPDEQLKPHNPPPIRKGNPPKIVVRVEDRQGGKKHTTTIANFEHFNLEAEKMCEVLSKKFASSATVTEHQEWPQSQVVKLAGAVGPQSVLALRDLFKVPTAFVDLQDKTRSGKKPK